APEGPGRRRRRWIPVAVAAALFIALVGVAALSSFDAPGDDRPAARAGTTDRASWLLVPTGRSRAEVRGLLGPPRRTRERTGDPASECWLYGARSGRALTYELCFRGDFLSDKSILPYRP
ncbi:MAG: hypothetical protein JHC71_02130, partial [Blastococcus sp.]|nr:hypothetical protein [Blastococcus sp.]